MHAISRRMAVLALGALALLGTACGDDEEGPTIVEGDISGTYALRTVNAQELPTTLINNTEGGFSYKAEVLSGFVTLSANERFSLAITIRETTNGGTPSTRQLTGNGTYTRSGNTLTLVDAATELTYTMTVQSDRSLVQTGTVATVPVNARYVKQ